MDSEFMQDTRPGAWRTDEGHQKWIKKVGRRKSVDVAKLKLNAALNEFQVPLPVSPPRFTFTCGLGAPYDLFPSLYLTRANPNFRAWWTS